MTSIWFFLSTLNTHKDNTYIHIKIHNINIHTNIHTYKHTYIHTNIHTHIHTYIPTNIHIQKHTYKHTNIHTYIHTNINTHIQTYIHTYIHVYKRTYIHTHKYTSKKSNQMQPCADIYLLLYYSTCFGRPSCPSPGVHKNILAASGTDHAVKYKTLSRIVILTNRLSDR